jgi:glutamine synthetase
VGFIEKFGLWSEEQQEAGRTVLARVRDEDMRWVRVCFVDQHGLLRGKTIAATALPSTFSDGLSAVSTLLSKDTSGATVFAAFNADGGLGVEEMAGAADLVMVPDPTTFRRIPWVEGTGWVLCDLWFRNGRRVPFCSRGVLRTALDRASQAGFAYLTGLEIEFHLYRRADHAPNVDGIARNVHPTEVEPINHGNQLLSEELGDELEPAVRHIRNNLSGMGIALRSIEVEYGANQLEVSLDPMIGLTSADAMMILRSTVKQIARRSAIRRSPTASPADGTCTSACSPKAPTRGATSSFLQTAKARSQPWARSSSPDSSPTPAQHASSPTRRSTATSGSCPTRWHPTGSHGPVTTAEP